MLHLGIEKTVATAEDRALMAYIASHASWAKTEDRTARTHNGRQAFLARFEREVDPDGVLLPAERARRAANKRKEYFGKLARKSAQARRRRRSDITE
jgi:hypothetical protein